MKGIIFSALASLAHMASAVGVVGKAEGFATGVTGGGSATPQYPKDIAQLSTWLTDATARVIVLDKTFDYTTSEGTVTGTACANWGTGAKCQRILLDSCGSGTTKETVTYYKAAKSPIKVGSNKTILGIGAKGIIKGKGLSFAGKNVIVQNIQVSDLNHKYVWGGDALSFAGADLIWIDHVTVCVPLSFHKRRAMADGFHRPLAPVASITSLVSPPALASPSPATLSTAIRTTPLAVMDIITGSLRWSAPVTPSL